MSGGDTNSHGVKWLKSRQLKRKPDTGEGTTILNIEPGKTSGSILLDSDKELELFVISGALENEFGDTLVEGGYSYRKGKSVQMPMRPVQSGRVLVSHGANLKISTG